MKYTDQQIVTGIKAGDVSFYHYFYDTYAAALYGEISRTLFREVDACDTLELAFKKIWTEIKTAETNQPLFISALTIVRRETSKKRMELVLKELFYCQQAHDDSNPVVTHPA